MMIVLHSVDHWVINRAMGKILIVFLWFCSFSCFAEGLDGTHLNWMASVPFLALLLSLAFIPLWFTEFWESHQGKIALFWAVAVVFLLIKVMGFDATFTELLHVFISDYCPFLILISSLYIINNGIRIRIQAEATPLLNVGVLTIGTLLASLIGTTGASMLLIRPLIAINKDRAFNKHVIIFFVFLVANVGGCLTPLGDPPLFLGFLQGVDFFWPMQNLFPSFLIASLYLLVIFYFVDRRYADQAKSQSVTLSVEGKMNFVFLGVAIGLVVICGLMAKGSEAFYWKGIPLRISDLIRDFGLIVLAGLSYKLTSKEVYQHNDFSWEPLKEVAMVFAAIFTTLIPLAAMLKAGPHGVFSSLLTLANPDGVPNNFLYFWLSGFFSSFLDNAPTYLIFFHMTGAGAEQLMTVLSKTLVAISLGSVFMGAMTYIGNAPNFMVKSIAVRAKIDMPGFLGYMMWSGIILLPLLAILSLLWF